MRQLTKEEMEMTGHYWLCGLVFTATTLSPFTKKQVQHGSRIVVVLCCMIRLRLRTAVFCWPRRLSSPAPAMAPEGLLPLSLAAIVEDVLKQHGRRPCDVDLASRISQEAGARRYEAAGWLRKVVGVVMAKDLPNEPSEEEFRLGLRNGLILCTALNKFHPGAVPKAVVNPADSVLQPDGAALSAYQYFENVRNFLVAVQELGIPTFEASDLEQRGKSARIVNYVLALKSYGEWKQMGGHGTSKYGRNLKQSNCGKSFIRNNSEKFNSSNDMLDVEHNVHGDTFSESAEMTTSGPVNMLVQAIIKDKRPEEVPQFVGSLLNKVMEEFERHIASQNEMVSSVYVDGIKY